MSTPDDPNVSTTEALAEVPHNPQGGALGAESSSLDKIINSFPRIEDPLPFKVGLIRLQWDDRHSVLALCPHVGDERETLLGPCTRLGSAAKGVNWLGAYTHTTILSLLEQAEKRNDVTSEMLSKLSFGHLGIQFIFDVESQMNRTDSSTPWGSLDIRLRMWSHGKLAVPMPQSEAGGGVYHGFTGKMSSKKAIDYLKGLDVFSTNYQEILSPESNTDSVLESHPPVDPMEIDGGNDPVLPADEADDQASLELQNQGLMLQLRAITDPKEILSFLHEQEDKFDWDSLPAKESAEVTRTLSKAYEADYKNTLAQANPVQEIYTEMHYPDVALQSLWNVATQAVSKVNTEAQELSTGALEQLEQTMNTLRSKTDQCKKQEKEISNMKKN